MATTSTDHRIKVPDGLTLGDLLDAIDRDRRRTVGSSIARNRGADAYPHSFGYLVSSVANFLADRRSVDELRQALATVELITMGRDSYDHLVAMADDRRDAVEHARRLAAERSVDDDGPVAA